LIGYDSLLERAFDGYLIKTYLPDNSVIESFWEKQELEGYNKFEINTVHVLKWYDMSLIKVKQNGEAVILSSNAWYHLNWIGMNLEIPWDKDYFFELFG